MNWYSGTFRKYLGWCPHAAGAQDTRIDNQDGPNPAVKKDLPESTPAAHTTIPDGFTTLSILILFATLFVGGYIWWPAIVLGITIAGLMAFWARSEARGRA